MKFNGGMKNTERQKLSRNMNWNIRLLCGIYAQARNCAYLTAEEAKAVVMICDRALERIRGESESDKRSRERNLFENISNSC